MIDLSDRGLTMTHEYRVRQTGYQFVLEFRDPEYGVPQWHIIRDMYSWEEARGCAALHNCQII